MQELKDWAESNGTPTMGQCIQTSAGKIPLVGRLIHIVVASEEDVVHVYTDQNCRSAILQAIEGYSCISLPLTDGSLASLLTRITPKDPKYIRVVGKEVEEFVYPILAHVGALCSIPRLGQLLMYTIDLNSTNMTWQWLHRDGTLYPYDPKSNAEIVRMYEEYETYGEPTTGKIRIANVEYIIDFVNMKQVRLIPLAYRP